MNSAALPSFVLALGVATSYACAHSGPRIWLGIESGALVTYTSDNDLAPTTYLPSRIFQATLAPASGVLTTSFPGFEARRDGVSNPAPGTVVGFQIAGPLLTLNASADRLQATSTTLGITRGTASSTTSAGVKSGFDFFQFNSSGDHAHLSYTLLGDGASPTSPAPEGAYVLPLRLTSSAASPSRWYFLVLGNNASEAARGRATDLAAAMRDAAPGDTNFDGSVNFDDLLTLAQHYGTEADAWWATGDFNFDGGVRFDDLLGLAQNYGAPANFASDWALAQSIAVPEPTLLTAVLLPLLPGRRRPV